MHSALSLIMDDLAQLGGRKRFITVLPHAHTQKLPAGSLNPALGLQYRNIHEVNYLILALWMFSCLFFHYSK